MDALQRDNQPGYEELDTYIYTSEAFEKSVADNSKTTITIALNTAERYEA